MSEREEALRRAQEAMRKLQHEVRTPLGQIMGYSELLEEELEDRDQGDLAPDLQKIRTAARRLLDLVDGKLKTEFDPGAPQLSPEPSDPTSAAGESDADAAETLGAAAGRQGASSGEAGARILVVDDDAQNRDLLSRRLLRHGFEVDLARDGIEALRRIDAGDYQLVMLDVMMPGMSGLEVLERVRRERSMSELPIIMATALGDSSDTVEGLERGANDYVAKPFDFPVVIARIDTQLAAHRSSRQVAKLARQLEFRNSFIRQALGREVSEDLLVELAEKPSALDLGGDRKRVSTVVADIRGARELSKGLEPAQFVALLNNVLSGLSDVVAHYEGTVEALHGDSLVAIFGLPVPKQDDAERAVACAVALQLEMDEINARGGRNGLPEVQVGVGVSTGDVVVGGFGDGDNVRYKPVGDALLRAGQIEATARGQEVWICAETRDAVADLLQTDCEREVSLPLLAELAAVHRVLGVGGTHLISLRSVPPPP